MDVTFVSFSVHTRLSRSWHLHALRYHDFCAEVGVRSFGGHLLDDVLGFKRGLICACGTCLQPILSKDPAAKGGESTRVFMTVSVADTF